MSEIKLKIDQNGGYCFDHLNIYFKIQCFLSSGTHAKLTKIILIGKIYTCSRHINEKSHKFVFGKISVIPLIYFIIRYFSNRVISYAKCIAP